MIGNTNVRQKMSGGPSWNKDENTAFERALAIFTDESENQWGKIAQIVSRKSVEQIKEHYDVLGHDVMTIESGCVPLPDYDVPEGINDDTSDKGKNILKDDDSERDDQKSKSMSKQIRRKGVIWSTSEHKNFLRGLEVYGKGDWRSISRHCVISRTPTQCASHAQKYFARLRSKEVPKNRSNIHVGTVLENTTRQAPVTWQKTQATTQLSLDRSVYGTSSIWNTQAIQGTTSQKSPDYPIYGTSSLWNNNQATQAISQQSLDHLVYGKSSMWKTQAIQTIPQQSLDHPINDTTDMWNSQVARAISQQSLDHPINGTANMWNTQAIQASTSQESLDQSICGTSSMWKTQAAQATQTISQQSLDLPMRGTSNIWNTEMSRATLQPPLDLPMHNTSNVWNSQATQVTSQPSLDTYGTNIWNAKTAPQQLVNAPNYETPTIDHSMVGRMLPNFGSGINGLAPPPLMAYGDHHQFVPNDSSVPSPSSSIMGSMPHNMTYMSDI